MARVGAAAVDVRDRPPGPRLRENPERELVAVAVDRDGLDVGKFFGEFREQRRLAVAPDVEVDAPLFFRGGEGPVPLRLPVGLAEAGAAEGGQRKNQGSARRAPETWAPPDPHRVFI